MRHAVTSCVSRRRTVTTKETIFTRGRAPDTFARMPGRDDRVLRATKWVALVVVLVLLPALVILWGMPGETADLWAWTITPDLTPIFMGAGYGAGAYFFTRVFLSPRWHIGAVGVFSAAEFAALMLITTRADLRVSRGPRRRGRGAGRAVPGDGALARVTDRWRPQPRLITPKEKRRWPT